MSFILDALRKSETERQRQSAPSLADARYQVTKKRRNVWLPLVTVILAANAVGIAFVVLNETPDAEVTDRNAPAPVKTMPVRPAPATIARTQPPPQAIDDAPPTPAVATRPELKPTTAVEKNSSAPADPQPMMLPSMHQLIASGQLSVAPLSVDLHVYAGEPGKRFVFINMKKYREGERLAEGPLVEEITDGGAILSHQGNRFTLERQ